MECYELPVIRPLKYLSPTSILEALEENNGCEYSFYLLRLGEDVIPRMEQTEPMAVGSAFDSAVKAEIAASNGYPNLLATLLASVSPQWHGSAPAAGRKLFNFYRECGAYQSLLSEGIKQIELDIKKGSREEVILYGKPDAQMVAGYPLDWKVNGYASIHGAYPKKGWAWKFDRYGKHWPEDRNTTRNFEDIDFAWAVQLLVYNWLLDQKGPYYGAIDQVACKDNNVTIACYRSPIGQAFADMIWKKVKSLWKRFNQGLIKVPVARHAVCEPYTYPRRCTPACAHYWEMLEKEKNPSMRDQVTNADNRRRR